MPAWPVEHDEMLKQLVADGVSLSRAAVEINARFHTSYSRNAAIGRATRQKFVCAERKVNQHARPSVSQSTGKLVALAPAFRKAQLGKLVALAPAFRKAQLPPLRCASVEPLHLSLLELDSEKCHYPFGDGDPRDFTFCGHRTWKGFSYCAPHVRLTTNNRQVNSAWRSTYTARNRF